MAKGGTAPDLSPKKPGGPKGKIGPSTPAKTQGRPSFKGPKDAAGKAAQTGK